MDLSIVTTLYKSAPYIEEFHRRASASAAAAASEFELVLVNDGSPDGCLEAAVALHRRDRRVRVVDLARNFGHHKAMMVGLAHARGDLVFLIDCDLEEPPESLAVLDEALRREEADVAFGVQKNRKGPWFQRATGSLFYTLFNWLSDHPIPRDPLTARLMTRRYVESLLLHREHLFCIEGLWEITGYRQVPVAIDKTHHKGASAYSLRRKVAYALNALTAFSRKPLLAIATLGLSMTLPAGLYLFWLLIQYFFLQVSVEGWTSLIASLWFLGGLIIFTLGIIAVYLSVIFVETKDRPYAIVRKVYESPPDAAGIPHG